MHQISFDLYCISMHMYVCTHIPKSISNFDPSVYMISKHSELLLKWVTFLRVIFQYDFSVLFYSAAEVIT